MLIFAEIIPPEPFEPTVFQQMILDDFQKVIFGITLLSAICIFQLFYSFIKPSGSRDNDEVF